MNVNELDVETELARYEVLKALCEVHQSLENAERLLGEQGIAMPDEIKDTMKWASHHIKAFGVERIGQVGEIVERDLVDHLSTEPKGTPVQITQAGYRLASGTVIFPAYTFKI